MEATPGGLAKKEGPVLEAVIKLPSKSKKQLTKRTREAELESHQLQVGLCIPPAVKQVPVDVNLFTSCCQLNVSY